jgi:type I restriction-modification system DNA methylase subunit
MSDKLFDKIHDLHNLLRNKEGIIGEKALYEINLCFTIRLLKPLLKKINLSSDCDFDKLIDNKDKDIDRDKLFEKYKKINIELQKNPIIKQFDYKNTNIKNSETCYQLIKTISEIDIENEDVKGKIYEYFIGRDKDSISDLGQYFTSYKIIDYCINLVKPTINDTILDPTCGSCGFLSNCASYLNKNNNNVDWKKVKKNFKGYDIAGDVVKIGLVNMLLVTGELFMDYHIDDDDNLHSDYKCIERKDTFRDSIGKKYDIILANPPYGGDKVTKKGGKDKSVTKWDNASKEIQDFNVKSNVKELLFLQMIMQNLKEGGRACVVLPEGLFKNIQDKSFIDTRKKLIEDFNVIEIGIANSGEFDNTSVNTCVIYFEKKGKTKNVIFKDISSNKEIIKVSYDDIKNKDYTLAHKIHVALLGTKKQKGYKLYELKDIIKIFERSKNDANDGKIDGEYRFYTCSFGSNLYTYKSIFKQRSIVCSRSCRSILNIDDNYGCSNSFHNFISNNKNIYIEWIYYYLKQNSFILDMLYAGTILKNLSRTILGYIKIHVPENKKDMEEIKKLHDIIQESKESSHKKIRELEKKISELDIVKKCITEPLFKTTEYTPEKQNANIVQKAHAIHNLLRNEEGIIGENALHEIQLVFLIKQLEKKVKNLGFPEEYKFSKLSEITDKDTLKELYDKIRIDVRNKFKDEFDIRDSKIKRNETLLELVKLVNSIDFDNTDEDIKGKLYEYFIGRDKKNIEDLGQYFTNHKIVSYCINLVKPTLNDTILDPTCGSGGFLINTATYLIKNNEDEIEWKKQKKKFMGYDIAGDICMTARINMFLATGEIFKEEQISRKDTLNEEIEDKYDIILANPP